jgi:HTH-type transcriptional repressor of NAD biosynthesis genes
VLGKFLPPHRGHQFLIDFARQYAEHLTVLVCTLKREPIPGELRYQWVRRMFPLPNVNIVHISENLPQTPEEHPHFWAIWRRVIQQACPDGVDFFFASEDYGHKLAEVIGARYVEVDKPRQLVPISGTAVRAQPLRHWEMLPEVVRPYFLKRVCIFGPESTGKTSLARDLAVHFRTSYAWEYARPLLDPQGGQCFARDIPLVVRGQMATEDAMSLQANRVLFCDTDVLTTTIWSDVLFGNTPQWIRDLADRRTYDLYLLLDVDVPWVDDAQRFFSSTAERRRFFDLCRAALDSRGRRYEIISGNWQERFAAAREAVERLIDD